jgi:hypothetical protein
MPWFVRFVLAQAAANGSRDRVRWGRLSR